MYGTGYQIRMPMMLKNRWHSATCHASTGLEDTTVAPMMPVSVVPMFAPSVSGNISSRLIRPTAQSGVSVDVVIELDWTRIVITSPMPMER